MPETAGMPVQGQLELEIHPNPVVAKPAGPRTWAFPFEVLLRESGGVDIEIEAIHVSVTMGGVPVMRQVWDPEEVRRRGYPTTIPAGGVLHVAFAPRRELANPAILELARAAIAVDVVDRHGRRSTAVHEVTVRLDDR